MLPADYLRLIQEEGISMVDSGTNGYALSRLVALKALRILQKAGVAVLGGDVVQLINNEFVYTYDNWYCQEEDYRSRDEYLQSSIDIAEQYIKNYNEPNNSSIFYLLVPEESYFYGVGGD